MRISTWCHIRNNEITVNGQKMFSAPEEEVSSFLKLAYKDLNIDYPKFYKMDALCKLGFLCSEWVFKKSSVLARANKNMIAMHVSNCSSSLESDVQHQKALNKDGMVSPAVFVYTLPNIVLGEISIRHAIQGDHCFYIEEKWSPESAFNRIESIVQIDAPEAILAGWLEYYKGEYHGFLYLLEPEGDKAHSKEELKALYHSH